MTKETAMLRLALAFAVLALLAAALGFIGIALAAAGIARILFFIFLLLCLFSLGAHFSGAPENGRKGG
jgi:uncharacterized membrane protein YtjA (UPF0391 family)